MHPSCTFLNISKPDDPYRSKSSKQTVIFIIYYLPNKTVKFLYEFFQDYSKGICLIVLNEKCAQGKDRHLKLFFLSLSTKIYFRKQLSQWFPAGVPPQRSGWDAPVLHCYHFLVLFLRLGLPPIKGLSGPSYPRPAPDHTHFVRLCNNIVKVSRDKKVEKR